MRLQNAQMHAAGKTALLMRGVICDMKIYAFDEHLTHRKIVPYDSVYEGIFMQIKTHVESSIGTVRLFHIGSTAIPDLRGKPMIDIAAVSTRGNLRKEQEEFEKLNFHRREVWVDTDDKPYVCGSVQLNGSSYNINIHICRRDDWVHKEGLSFVKALKARSGLRRKYELAKDCAHSLEPADPQRYNQAKEKVINEIYEKIKECI